MEYLNVAILNISVLNVRFILDFKTIISKAKYTTMRDFGKCGIAKLDALFSKLQCSKNLRM